MGIAVTVVVVVALLFVAGAALEDYAAEVRESPKTVQGNSSRDSLFRIDEGSCGTIQHGHAGCHTDSGCPRMLATLVMTPQGTALRSGPWHDRRTSLIENTSSRLTSLPLLCDHVLVTMVMSRW